MKRAISAREVEELTRSGADLSAAVAADALLTPSARDLLRSKALEAPVPQKPAGAVAASGNVKVKGSVPRPSDPKPGGSFPKVGPQDGRALLPDQGHGRAEGSNLRDRPAALAAGLRPGRSAEGAAPDAEAKAKVQQGTEEILRAVQGGARGDK